MPTDEPADESHAADAAPPTVPNALRAACVILVIEALGLVGIAVFLIYGTVFEHPGTVARALLGAALALIGAAVLVLGARGLLRMRPGARSPMVVLQLLAVPVSYSLAFQAGRVAYGGPILVAAVAVVYLLFTPPVRAVLDRDVHR